MVYGLTPCGRRVLELERELRELRARDATEPAAPRFVGGTMSGHWEPAAAEPPDELILKVIQESLSRGADQDSIDLFLFSLNESGLTIALERET